MESLEVMKEFADCVSASPEDPDNERLIETVQKATAQALHQLAPLYPDNRNNSIGVVISRLSCALLRYQALQPLLH